jgi:DNA primase
MFAEAYCYSNSVDVILMDVCTAMNANGIEAAAGIKKHLPRVKISIITSHPECSFIERARAAGVDSFWYKSSKAEEIITVIEKIENLDYFESVKFLAQKAGIQMPENDKKAQEISSIKTRIFEINREAARFFHENLYSEKGKAALGYLRKRGLSEKIIRKFGLGYSPNSRYELINHLKAKGFKYEEMVNANLAYARGNSSVSARFFDRVMFPIIDLRGNVIAFGGRIMSDQKPKYLNTSDTLAFKKSLNLFSLNFAKVDNDGVLLLVEGYMDVIALYQAGFTNAVATLGTALTAEQARIMSRYAKEVVICYDSDEAGQKAAARAIDLLRQTGVLIKVISVPKGKDPDEFIRSYGKDGAVRFAQLIRNSGNDVEYRLQKAAHNYNLSESEEKIA